MRRDWRTCSSANRSCNGVNKPQVSTHHQIATGLKRRPGLTEFIISSQSHLFSRKEKQPMGAESPTPASGQQPGEQPARMEYPTDTSHLSATYANFARVTFMPEELILDF